MRYDDRQSLVAKRTIQRDDDLARPDSNTTVQYVPGTGPRARPLQRRALTIGATKGL